jgi:hypothetical protein
LSDFSSPQASRGKGRGQNIYAYLSHQFQKGVEAPLQAQRDAIIKKYDQYGNLVAARSKFTDADRAAENAITDKILAIRDKGEKMASQYLDSLGIKGIKYLDQGSRDAGKGTRNFVLFDPKIAKIIGKQ